MRYQILGSGVWVESEPDEVFNRDLGLSQAHRLAASVGEEYQEPEDDTSADDGTDDSEELESESATPRDRSYRWLRPSSVMHT